MLGLGKKSIGVDFSVIVEATPKRIKHKSLVSDLWNIITLQQMSFNLSAFFSVFSFTMLTCMMPITNWFIQLVALWISSSIISLVNCNWFKLHNPLYLRHLSVQWNALKEIFGTWYRCIWCGANGGNVIDVRLKMWIVWKTNCLLF